MTCMHMHPIGDSRSEAAGTGTGTGSAAGSVPAGRLPVPSRPVVPSRLIITLLYSCVECVD